MVLAAKEAEVTATVGGDLMLLGLTVNCLIVTVLVNLQLFNCLPATVLV